MTDKPPSLATVLRLAPEVPVADEGPSVLSSMFAVLGDALAKEPETTIALGAFVVGMLCPCRERACERIIVSCMDAKAKRTAAAKAKAEKEGDG